MPQRPFLGPLFLHPVRENNCELSGFPVGKRGRFHVVVIENISVNKASCAIRQVQWHGAAPSASVGMKFRRHRYLPRQRWANADPSATSPPHGFGAPEGCRYWLDREPNPLMVNQGWALRGNEYAVLERRIYGGHGHGINPSQHIGSFYSKSTLDSSTLSTKRTDV